MRTPSTVDSTHLAERKVFSYSSSCDLEFNLYLDVRGTALQRKTALSLNTSALAFLAGPGFHFGPVIG